MNHQLDMFDPPPKENNVVTWVVLGAVVVLLVFFILSFVIGKANAVTAVLL